jgi:hypothetical protein
VRIADDLRKATVFLGEELADGGGEPAIDPHATGFFVAWQSDSGRPIDDMKPECAAYYLVTARHVAKPLGKDFAVRFNKKDSGSDIELIRGAKWIPHPDKTVDVAVLHCGFPDWADCIPIPGRMLTLPTIGDSLVSTAREDDLLFNNPNLGVGDIAYVVGLFHFVHGKKRNLPVVHTGHIALLPDDEKIRIYNRSFREWQDVEAYLVEAHGLEGLSGAPVFARTSSPVMGSYRYHGPRLQGGVDPSGMRVPGRLHGFTYLIGLWSGSWGEKASGTLAEGKKIRKDQKVPVGMGVVVPAGKIAETLNQPELIMARQKEYQRRLNEHAATTDSLRPDEATSPTTDGNPTHREDFNRLLNAAARKREEED